MREMPIIVSHYTKKTGYEKEVDHLIRSLKEFDLEYNVEGIDSLGNKDGVSAWRRNSNYCSLQVLRMLSEYPDRDILRVDADAVFKRHPSIFLEDDFTADVAAHIHTFRWHENELLGGTMFFRNNANVKNLVNKWALDCTLNKPSERNPDSLQNLLESGKFDVKFESLPDTYCTIFDIMEDVEKPVIVHYQASRRFKKQVNRG